MEREVSTMTADELMKLRNPTPEQLQERITRIVETYNYKRNTLTDDEVAKLRAYLSSDMYMFVFKIYKPAMDAEMAAFIDLEKVEAECYIEHFELLKKQGVASSVAETLARKYIRRDERYINAITSHKDSENLVKLANQVLKMATNVINSMSYKSN